MARGRKTRKKKRPSKSSTATVTRKGRESVKRLQWSDDSMLAAMEAVKNGSISINKAAVLHGVPRTTLYKGHVSALFTCMKVTLPSLPPASRTTSVHRTKWVV